MRAGHVHLHAVLEDGTTRLVDSSPPGAAYRWGGRIAAAGAALCFAAMTTEAIGDPDGSATSNGG
jgi:hypothetical protein